MQPSYAHYYERVIILSFFFVISSFLSSEAQIKPGYITRPASGGGGAILDPNADGYSSATTAGFGAPSDVATSEIPYKIVQSYSTEPFGDLRRGPNHNYSDFVPDGGQDGFYTYFTGTNFLFRFRLGSIMPGSKGYSILMDTDGKFGATGPNADPNYQPATTGTNGNPGFEIEIVMETNFRIAIYNVDGTSSPALITSYSNWQDMSQVSLAATNDNGDPDFFMDFYIPFSALTTAPFNLNETSPIRLIPTTVMSPQAAIGGPKSDIYGLSDPNYPNTNTQYEDFINNQPLFNVNDLTSGGGGIGGMCSAPPVVNAPISTGTVNISGTWTASSLSGAVTTAVVTVYKNGVSAGTVNGVTSGSTWSLNSVSVSNGDVITAKAQGAGESMCLISNSVTASSCNSSNRPAQPTGFCGDRKGFSGTNYPAGATISIYRLTSSGRTLTASGTPGNNGFAANGAGWTLSGGCSAGGGAFLGGTYEAFYTLAGCDSKSAFTCAPNTQAGWSSLATTSPVISNAGSIYTSTTNISGTAVAGSLVRIYIDDIFIASPTLVATNWSYTFTSQLLLGQVITVSAQIADDNAGKIYYCTGSVSTTVTCFTSPPILNADGNNQLAAGQPVTGISSDPVGTTIRVYNISGPTLVGTTTVQAGGVWSTATVPFNAVAGASYYATAQNSTCGLSINSGNVSAANNTSAARCGTITGPVSSGATTVSGTLASVVANTTVRLYLDGVSVGSVVTATTSWTVSAIPSTTIYSNGVLTIGIQEIGNREVVCPASLTVACTPAPTAPTFTPINTTIGVNQTVTYTITNAVAGTFYAIANSVTGASLGTGAWATANGNLSLTTNPIAAPGSYSIVIKATSLSGVTVCTTSGTPAGVVVSGTLPVGLVVFSANWYNSEAVLNWVTESEQQTDKFIIERSVDGINYFVIGTKQAAGNSYSRLNYSFTDRTPQVGTNYYRLRMVDIDGRYKYSSIVVLRSIKSGEWKVGPNPFNESLTVTINNSVPAAINLKLTNVTGQVLIVRSQQVLRGISQVTLSNLEGLASGIYFLQVESSNGNIREVIKCIKE